MLRPYSLPFLVPLTLVVLLLATSCSSGSSSLTAPNDSERPLILVLYGDSLLTFPKNGGAIDAYVEMLEEDLGAPVNVQLPAMGPFFTQPAIVHHLNSDQAETELARADVVIFESPNVELLNAVIVAAGLFERSPADCGGDDDQQCLRDALAGFKDSVETNFAILTETVDPSETLIRAVVGYAPFVTEQIIADTLAMTNPYWQESQEFFAATAAKFGIPTAQVFDEFNGPDGTNDPQDRGLIAADGLHPSEAGALLIAETIHDLGYDFAN